MRRAYWLIVLSYLSALASGLAVLAALRGQHPLLVLAAANIVATMIVFGWSVHLDNSSVYDPYWSVAPICFVLFWWLNPAGAGEPVRQLLIALLVSLWGVRLTANWVAR